MPVIYSMNNAQFWDIVDDMKLEKCKAISQLNREHIAGTVATTTF